MTLTLTEPRTELPADVAVLCGTCSMPVPLVLFVAGHGPLRQVTCPDCADLVVLHDAW